MTEVTEFDVLIVGGGMVGATLGRALADTNLRIGLIEQRVPAPYEPEQAHDLRVSALSLASKNILESCGAWEGVLSRRYCPLKRMRVWETAGIGDTTFNSEDIGYPELGFIVENRIVQLALWDQFAAQDNITTYAPAVISSIECHGSSNQVTLASGDVLTSRLLVAADGGASQVRQAAGLGVVAEEYSQQALVLYVKTAYPQQDITWQRFYPAGPRAFLPLSGSYGSLVWYDTPETIKRLMALDDESLLEEAYAAFPSELGEIDTLCGRGFFPLKRQHALSYGKEGVVLLGDAAHMIHPLAGQGVNIGMHDVASFSELLHEAIVNGEDIGAEILIKRYEKQRRNHNTLMMTTMDLFYRIFKDEKKPISLLRNLGLQIAQRVTPARNKAMKFAMGIEGPLPAMAKR